MIMNIRWPLKAYRHAVVDQDEQLFAMTIIGRTESVNDQYKRTKWIAQACNTMKQNEEISLDQGG